MPLHVVFKPLKGAFKNIPEAEAKQMLANGLAYQPDPKMSPGVYYEKVPPAPAAAADPEPEPEPVAELARDHTYETRAMEAAPPVKRRRGRPPKNRQPAED